MSKFENCRLPRRYAPRNDENVTFSNFKFNHFKLISNFKL